MERSWTSEITRERLAALQVELEWALQRQNARFSDRMPTSRMSVERRRAIALIVFSVLALVLAYAAWTDPRVRHTMWFATGVVAAAAGFVMALFLPRLRAWSKRTAGSMLTRRAAGILAPVLRRAPYTIEYKLAGDELAADVPALKLHRTLPLAHPKLVLATPGLVIAFRDTHALNPLRVIYAADGDRAALLAAFAACGVACEEVSGPADGYTPPVPEARLT